MMFLTVLQEILIVIVVVGHFLERKILSECLSQVEYLEVLPFYLLQLSPVDHCQSWDFRNSPHSDVRIPQFIPHQVMFHI